MLDQITPVILTYNEAPNIGRTLERLSWARDIVVVDSLSDDETLAIVATAPQARAFERKFVSLEDQWNFALRETSITTDWVLALDADYILTPGLVEELSQLKPDDETAGYSARFVYCINGSPLRGAAYPPVVTLYRHKLARYRQDGHAHRVVIEGNVDDLRAPILHDDRKSLGRWLQSQNDYMKLETRKLLETDRRELGWPDRIRKMIVVAPPAMFLYCLFVKGAILDGRPGLYYAFQRLLSETLLSLYLIDQGFAEEEEEADEEEEVDEEPAEASESSQEAAEHSQEAVEPSLDVSEPSQDTLTPEARADETSHAPS
jgi:glycosyltransferase involved in cell wall biosynthesis